MDELELRDYFKQYKDSLKNINDKAKATFFIRYLQSTLGKEAIISPDVFALLDKDFLLDSIDAYIKEKQPKVGVARDYRRTILDLCNDACQKYDIVNVFLDSISERSAFDQTTDEWFENLKQSESRDCMSSEEFEILEETINDFFNTDDLEYKITKSIESTHSKPNYYGWLVSAIALKLIRYYGLDNGALTSLKTTDLDMQNCVIHINGFTLPIAKPLISDFRLYLKCRNSVLGSTKKDTDILFVKRNGTHYCDINKRPDCGQLFLLLDSTFNHTSSTGLRYRTIIELVSRGANIDLLCKLTGVKSEKIVELCSDDRASLENLFHTINNTNTSIQSKRRKGQIQCPYCGNYSDASSENWILIQVVGDEKKHLACRNCRGYDGKYRY